MHDLGIAKSVDFDQGLQHVVDAVAAWRGDIVGGLAKLEAAAEGFRRTNDAEKLTKVETMIALVQEKLKASEQSGGSSSQTDTGA